MRLSVLFLLWPLAEIAAFILLGGAIGVLASLAIILATAAFGVWLLRGMGLRRWPRDPLQAAASGGMTLLAALLLILPGFITDAIGLLLLLPPVQVLVAALLARHMVTRRETGRAGADIIDGEFIEIDPEGLPPRRQPSDWTRH